MEDNKYDEILEKLKSFESILNDISEKFNNVQNDNQNKILDQKSSFYITNLILSFIFIFLLEIYGLFYNKTCWVVCAIILFLFMSWFMKDFKNKK